jgi:hypothetical protein
VQHKKVSASIPTCKPNGYDRTTIIFQSSYKNKSFPFLEGGLFFVLKEIVFGLANGERLRRLLIIFVVLGLPSDVY